MFHSFLYLYQRVMSRCECEAFTRLWQVKLDDTKKHERHMICEVNLIDFLKSISPSALDKQNIYHIYIYIVNIFMSIYIYISYIYMYIYHILYSYIYITYTYMYHISHWKGPFPMVSWRALWDIVGHCGTRTWSAPASSATPACPVDPSPFRTRRRPRMPVRRCWRPGGFKH